jgi:hypothetical protein
MVARIQMYKVEKANVSSTSSAESSISFLVLPRIIVEVINLMAKILVYSAIKINAKDPLLYSTLKPETSSDSPSAKSNGVRLVSAKLVINHNIAATGISRRGDLR